MISPLYLTESEVAERLGLSVKTLRDWRYRKCEIPFHKFGARILYCIDDLKEWEDSHRIEVRKKKAA